MERIAVLTSGGDAPGMNAAVRALARRAWSLGLEVMGIRRGFAGLISGEIIKISNETVSDQVHRGGTFLLTARSKKYRNKEGQEKAFNQLMKFEIDGLCVIGGDGSMAGAKRLHDRGIKVIGIPATIDKDLACTDYTIGFDTAMNTIVDAVNKIRDTASSHERVFVVEVMGRESGQLTLESGLAVGAESILIPEIDFNMEKICKKLYKGHGEGKGHNIIMVAEGIGGYEPGMELQGNGAFRVARDIQNRTGFETRIIVLGHVQRGGSPSAKDCILASRFGARAAELLYEDKSCYMVGFNSGEINEYSFCDVLNKEIKFDDKLYKLTEMLA